MNLIPSQPRRWTDARAAGERCQQLIAEGHTIEGLAAKCGVAATTVRRWIFMYETGAYRPTTPREYAKALSRLIRRIGQAETMTRLHVSESWIKHTLELGNGKEGKICRIRIPQPTEAPRPATRDSSGEVSAD